MRNKNQKGVAVVIVLVLVAIMMSFAAGSAVIATSSLKQIGRIVAANEAYYAAEGALEEALLKVSEYGTGYTAKDIHASNKTVIKGTEVFGKNAALEDYCSNLEAAANDNNSGSAAGTGGTNFGGTDSSGTNVQDGNQGTDGTAGTDTSGANAGDVSVSVNCDEILAAKAADATGTDGNSGTGTQAASTELVAEAKWKIIGFSPDDDDHKIELKDSGGNVSKFYSVPTASSGDAGGEWCNDGVEIPIIVGGTGTSGKTGMTKFLLDEYNAWVDALGLKEGQNKDNLKFAATDSVSAADHPCHWNKLYVSSVGGGPGKAGTVTIPLFVQYEGASGTDADGKLVVRNPASTAFAHADGTFEKFVTGFDDGNGKQGKDGLGFGGTDKILIRFRTPCKPLPLAGGGWKERTWCKASERYTLDTSEATGDGENVLVNWEIVEAEKNPCGEIGADGISCAPDPASGVDPYEIQHAVGPLVYNKKDQNATPQTSTEIREQFINKFNPSSNLNKPYGVYTVFDHKINAITKYLDAVYEGNSIPNGGFGQQDDMLRSYLRDHTADFFGPINDWSKWKLYKPLLKLTALHTLENSDTDVPSKQIPYLEYQILSSTDFEPFSDAFQTVIAEGKARGVKRTIQIKKPQESTALEYVIQQ